MNPHWELRMGEEAFIAIEFGLTQWNTMSVQGCMAILNPYLLY